MPSLPLITNFLLTDHARFETARRRISEKEMVQVLATPKDTELGSVVFGRCK